MATKKLRFISKGSAGADSHLYDAETGAELQHCVKLEVTHDPTQPTSMIATFWDAEIDVEAQAEIIYDETIFPLKAKTRIPFIKGESPKDLKMRIAEAMTLEWWPTREEKSPYLASGE